MPASWIRFLFWCYLLVLVGAEGMVTNPADPDLWHRLALGDYLAQTHHFPEGGTFSYLADYPGVIADHEWGSAVIFYALYSWGGGSAMVGLKLISLAMTMGLVVWAGFHGRRPTVLFAAFYAVVLLALLPSFQSTVRCMVFTHLFLALWILLYQLERHGRRVGIWIYPATMVLWANLHGGFALGLAWLAGVAVVQALAGKPWRVWLTRLALSALATLVNPFGYNLWRTTWRALTTSRNGFDEWGPVAWWPAWGSYPGYKILLLGTGVSLGLLLWRRGWRRMDRAAVLLIGGAVALSLISTRHTSLFAVVTGALLPDLIPHEPTLRSIENPLERLSYLFMRFTLVLLPLYAALLTLRTDAGLRLQFPTNSCPVGAVEFLRNEKIEGNLLVPFNYGSYAMWKLRGKMRVSMDGRYDLVYRPSTYWRVENFFAARSDWPELLKSPAPEAILTPRADGIYSELEAQAGWREAYDDKTDAVFLPR